MFQINDNVRIIATLSGKNPTVLLTIEGNVFACCVVVLLQREKKT